MQAGRDDGCGGFAQFVGAIDDDEIAALAECPYQLFDVKRIALGSLGHGPAQILSRRVGIELGVDEPQKAYFNRALAYEGLDNLKAAYFDFRKAQELAPEWDQPGKELSRYTVERR